MLEFLVSNLPIIVNGKYKVRLIDLSDKGDLFKIYSNENVAKYICRNIHETYEDTISFINLIEDRMKEGSNLYLGISMEDEDKIIGIIRFIQKEDKNTFTIGYGLSESFWGEGIIPEVLNVIIEIIQHNIKEVSFRATIRPDNYKSIKCIEKLEFKLKGEFYKIQEVNGKMVKSKRLLYYKELE